MKTLACIAFAAAALAWPAAAQDNLTERPSIVVIGNGGAEAPPDKFMISIAVEGRGETRVDALRTFSEAQARLLEALPQLQGLTDVRMTTGDISVQPRHEPSCGVGEYDRDTSDCPVIGYSVTSELTFRGSPAERAGDAISMASEIGATSATLNGYALTDIQALQDAANRAAFLDAERQAQMLAEASGRRIVRILRIQDPSAATGRSGSLDDVVVTGARRRLPTVSIAVAPEPVRAAARVTVAFEIE